MRNSRVNFLVKIQIRCWDINKTRQGITFICHTLYNKLRHRYRGTTANAVPNPAITAVSITKSNPITAVLTR